MQSQQLKSIALNVAFMYIAYRQVDLNSDTKTITHSKFKLRGVFLLVSLNSKLLQFLDNSIWI